MKKMLAMLLAMAMLLVVFAGCGKNDSTKSDAAVFKIGGCGPLTGGAAIYGNAVKNGAQIAVDEVNAQGGIQLELRYEDDAHDAEKSVNGYNTLKDWGMQIFLGSVTSTPCVATSAESSADNIFCLTPSASSTDVLGGVQNPLTGTIDVERKANTFQMCFMDPNQGSASAQYISEKKLGTKIAIIYKNDDVYSTGIYNSFMTKAKELGLNVVSTTTFTEDTQNDFSVQIADAKDNGADLIFLPMYYTPASLILRQSNDIGYKPAFFGVDGMDGILTMKNFDTSLAEGVMLLTPFSANSEDAATQSFVKAYTEEFGVEPNQFAADAYDAVYIVKAALEKAGCTGDMTAPEICDAIVGVMTSLSVDGLTGKAMTWNAEGEVSKAPLAAVIENGQYVMK